MSKFSLVAFPDEESASAGVHALDQLHQDGVAVVYGTALLHRNEAGAPPAKRRGGDASPGPDVAALVGGLVDELLGRAERELAPGTFAVLADVSEEWGASIDQRMEALGGRGVCEWGEEDLLCELLAKRGTPRDAGLVALMAERAVAKAERMAAKVARLVQREQNERERRANSQQR